MLKIKRQPLPELKNCSSFTDCSLGYDVLLELQTTKCLIESSMASWNVVSEAMLARKYVKKTNISATPLYLCNTTSRPTEYIHLHHIDTCSHNAKYSQDKYIRSDLFRRNPTNLHATISVFQHDPIYQ